MERRRSQSQAEVHSEQMESREALCERCRGKLETSFHAEDHAQEPREIAVAKAVLRRSARSRKELSGLRCKEEIRKQDLKARKQVYAVAAIARKERVSMKEAATIYLESQPKAK